MTRAPSLATGSAPGCATAGDHLTRLPSVMLVRALRTWDFWQPRYQAQVDEGQNRTVAFDAVLAYYLLLPLAAVGLLVIRRRRVELVLLGAPLLAVTLTSFVGWGFPRFRYAAEPSLVVLAAIALTTVPTLSASGPKR